MSRLDSFIRRVSAQRACLNMAAGLIGDVPGVVLELGLGNGRTYDHLREILPGREIYVFERRVAAHPDCIPDDDHLLLGDLFATLPEAGRRIGAPAALAHADIGTGDPANNARIAAFLCEHLPILMAPRALIVSDQRLTVPGWSQMPLPAEVQPDRYFILRRD